MAEQTTEKKTKSNLPEGVTDEMVKSWKERYGQGNVKIASLPMDDNADKYLDVIVRVPDRKTMSEFEKWLDKNPDKAKTLLINACLLTHKDEVKADDNLFFAAFDAIAELIPVRKSILKNL